MTIQLPQYTGKDYLVLAMVLLPFTILMNSIVFGTMYYSGLPLFLEATLITGLAFVLDFTLCGFIAVLLKERFPDENQAGRKLSLMIITFLVVSGLFLLLLFKGYEIINFHGYTFNERGFIWAYVFQGILNIFLTFLFEGIAHFQNWQANLRETEELQKAYQQGQLQGLKSQVNPHFLFNSLNSLSSLIQDDEEEAELFLDEMTKVYRYMLRNSEDQLVPVQTEIKFLESYIYLLTKRYGEGLLVTIEIDPDDLEKMLPPLALQVLIESAFTQNMTSKASPLRIDIYSENQQLLVRNIIQPKVVKDTFDDELGLDNLVKKYMLLNRSAVVIDCCSTHRVVRLPLIAKKEEVLV
ncbi:sensor histidine kinase [Flavihumibacter fluvii]|uniref:sensor histidine kinase n=1 Tax=Flavihumibacter fluvii TaxID=2838157 RepID=UPI001BDDFD2B|nr:histidine kinase [Flavihumibacter fluvii]ULQ53166.1 histidine kinase [Flavihumibacter fluvii]